MSSEARSAGEAVLGNGLPDGVDSGQLQVRELQGDFCHGVVQVNEPAR